MAYRSRSTHSRSFLSPEWFPPGVKWLLIVNVSIFLVLFVSRMAGMDRWYSGLELQPSSVAVGAVWQVVTYAFIHVGVLHIFWNALSLWSLGIRLEGVWGTRRFVQFYFICLVGAAIVSIIGSYLFFDRNTPFAGASGAVFGLLVAFGFVFAGQEILFIFFPIKAEYLAMLMGALFFFLTLDTRGAFLAHLGGMLTALVYMLYFRGKTVPAIDLSYMIQQRYKRWKIERARKKFQVYLRKNDPDRDRWVN